MTNTKVFKILANKSPKDILGKRGLPKDSARLSLSEEIIEKVLDLFANGKSPKEIKQYLSGHSIAMKQISEILFARESYIEQNILGK